MTGRLARLYFLRALFPETTSAKITLDARLLLHRANGIGRRADVFASGGGTKRGGQDNDHTSTAIRDLNREGNKAVR